MRETNRVESNFSNVWTLGCVKSRGYLLVDLSRKNSIKIHCYLSSLTGECVIDLKLEVPTLDVSRLTYDPLRVYKLHLARTYISVCDSQLTESEDCSSINKTSTVQLTSVY